LNVREATPDELADWDARTVDRPGGHVLQSRAWAEHRRASGWSPRFLATDDGVRVLALTRSWPLIGGGGAYVPRGPIPDAGGDVVATRLVSVADFLAGDGIDVVAADPEVAATDTAFAQALGIAGFRPIEEIQPSRHRISLPLDGRSEDEVFAAISKSTRQRIRQAERDDLSVVRHDERSRAGGPGDGFVAPTAEASAALDRFYDLLLETGERRHFSFGPRESFVGWWSAALGAGHLVYLEARTSRADDPGRAGEAPYRAEPSEPAGVPVAGLILYRHGGRFSTVHSGDHAGTREAHPGALHLLRWRAIQLAIREGCMEMDLGGVDVAGARHEPREGDALYGLYQHKRSFGGEWLELAGAHERVTDARGYALGRALQRAARLVRR
jgi:lipid II:glycine glycyltransferase (peptidoglycan interpeptide bridge formation enzyme)